jgi:hypothetical protein
MLTRLSDFYRIVNPTPADGIITQRREAITAFLEQLAKPEIRNACIEIAAFGFGATPSPSHTVAAQLLIAAIQVPQPSFSSDIATNALDLRVCAGVALGEYLNFDSSELDDEDAAALVISALATRPLPQERYLAEFVSALIAVARQSLERAGLARRERPDLTIPEVQGASGPEILKSVNSALGTLRAAVDRNLQANREELQILWWVFGEHSSTIDKPFRELDLAQRTMAAGSELAELALLPPVPRATQFLLSVLREDRPLTLRQLIQSCGADILRLIVERTKEIDAVLKAHPALLPLMWLCDRRIDSGFSPGWEIEFEQKTHISPDDERVASIWAAQIFNECVAARFLLLQKDQE